MTSYETVDEDGRTMLKVQDRPVRRVLEDVLYALERVNDRVLDIIQEKEQNG